LTIPHTSVLFTLFTYIHSDE